MTAAAAAEDDPAAPALRRFHLRELERDESSEAGSLAFRRFNSRRAEKPGSEFFLEVSGGAESASKETRGSSWVENLAEARSRELLLSLFCRKLLEDEEDQMECRT